MEVKKIYPRKVPAEVPISGSHIPKNILDRFCTERHIILESPFRDCRTKINRTLRRHIS
jgi:hypothetical protein